ncbi:PepSY-associated TM helix domain-containing protein [Acinetobacter calcoaceticus]|uniref:PepSY-associated TM helix domain-containing protein n=1 Tax=Acinetobacter calcoaceticus TaxID=471 RepID=UPI00300B1A7F
MLTHSSFWRSLFRLIHIYAGIFIAPLILVAAITGLLYAITPQLEQAMYKNVLNVEPLNQAQYKLSQQIEAAKQVMPKSAQVIEVRPAPSADQTTRIIFSDPLHDFTSEAVFIDPFTLQAKGHLAVYGTSGVLPFRTTLDQLHSNLLLGKWGRFYSELAASWLAILTLTGLYNWWKRRQNLKIRQTQKNKLLRWHSTLGLFLFPLLLIIAITGLTWSEWAGDNIRVVRQWLNWQTPTLATSLQTDNLPTVMHHEHHEMPHSENLNLNIVSSEFDTALSIARAHGIDAAKIQIKPPTSGNQAWTVAEIQRKWPTQADSIAIDMEQHKVIDQLAFKDYSFVAKLTRWGVDAHIGILFGLMNQLVLALYALALCFMIIYAYKAAFKNSNLKLMTSHFVGQSLFVWTRATGQQKVLLMLAGIVLGLSLPVFGFSILLTILILAMRKYIPSKS